MSGSFSGSHQTYTTGNAFLAKCSKVCWGKILEHSAKKSLLSVPLGKKRHSAQTLFVECRTLVIQRLSAHTHLPSVQISTNLGTRQSAVSNWRSLTMPSAKQRYSAKRLALPSANCSHSSYMSFVECLFLTLDKVYFIFSFLCSKLFILCSYNIWTNIWNFGTFLKVYDISIRFSSFNWISLDNSNWNYKSLE
jgi:hypothetical protein